MGFAEVFSAAAMPVLKVLLVTAVGCFCALDRINILGVEATKHFNSITFYVLNPALAASNLAKSITQETFLELWFMPVSILFTYIIGSILGLVVNACTRTPPHLRALVIGCCAAGNLGNLMFVVLPAFCNEKGSPFGDPDVCYSQGLGYASLSMTFGRTYLWSYVYNVLRISSSKYSKQASVSTSLPESSVSIREDTVPLLSNNLTKSQVGVSEKIKQKLVNIYKNFDLRKLFSPSIIGVIIGIVVGVTPPLRKLLIGSDAPLHVIHDSATMLGDGGLPALTMIMGANLLKGLRGPGIQKSLVIGIVLVRYVMLPLSGIVIVKGAIRLGLIQANPLYQFVLMLQFCLPPALNIGTMTQLFGAGEAECSVIMLWTYLFAAIALTLWSTAFLFLIS